MTPFKIGSIYRNKRGSLVRLVASNANSDYPALSVRLDAKGHLHGEALHCLLDGKNDLHGDAPEWDLIPGEVNEQGEPIAPTFYCAAETIKPIVLINRPGIKFVVTVPAGLSVTPADLHMVARDDKRAPLQSQSAGRYDPFKGFVVKRDTATPDHAYSHPLTRVADAGAQVSAEFGSAWLVVR